MRKIVLALAVVAAAAAAFVAAPKAQAQTFPTVTCTAFSPECNYMSQPGYLRYRVFVQSNYTNWISYTDAARIVAEQG